MRAAVRNLLRNDVDRAGSVVGVVFAVVHGVGAYRAHMVGPERDGADGVIVHLAIGMEVDEEIDPVIADVEGRGAFFVLDPIHTRNLFCARVLDLEAGGQHVRDDDIIYVGAEGALERQLNDDEIILLERISG